MPLRDEDFENVDAGEPHLLLPREGWYPAKFHSCETREYGSWGEKLIFHWHVFLSSDTTHFVPVNRYYNVERDGGGRFKFGPLHDFRKDWIAANRGRLPSHPSRLPMKIWRQSL